MKTSQTLLSLIIALFGLMFTSATAQAQLLELYHDVVGNIGVQNEPVTQRILQQWNPYTFNLDVPADAATTLQGFDIGFTILPSVPDHSVQLDAVKITHFSYSVNHLDVTTGIETPVKFSDGTPMTSIDVQTYGAESQSPHGPVVFTTPLGMFSPLYGEPNSPTGTNIVGTTVQDVGVIFVTKMSLNWGFVPDFTKPSYNQGYVVRFDVRVVPTYFGVQYPEKQVKMYGRNDIAFVYQVVDVPTPEFVSLKSYTLNEPWGNGPGQDTESGVVLQMSGTHLEYFKLQRSSDMQTWTDWPFAGEGSDWSWPYTIPDPELGGYWPNTYQWTMFDMNYPNERRAPQREFYRMVWTGKRGVWRIWSMTQYPPWMR